MRPLPHRRALTVRWPWVKNVPGRASSASRPRKARRQEGEYLASAHALELAERPHVNQQSAFHLGEGRSHLVIVFVRERCRQVLPEPVEILADDAADLLVAGGPMPGVRWRPAGPGRHARQRRHAERLVLV